VGEELASGIESQIGRIARREAFHGHQIGMLARRVPDCAPARHGLRQIRNDVEPVDQQQRPAIDADIAVIGKARQQIARETFGRGRLKSLRQKNFVLAAVPAPGPVLVGPAQTEGKIELALRQQQLQRFFEQTAAVEPVVMQAEAAQTGELGQIDLSSDGLAQAQIVKSEFTGQVRLLVPGKQRGRFHDRTPLGKPLAPPVVVFRNRMKLRQIEGQGLDRPRRASWFAKSRYGKLANALRQMADKTRQQTSVVKAAEMRPRNLGLIRQPFGIHASDQFFQFIGGTPARHVGRDHVDVGQRRLIIRGVDHHRNAGAHGFDHGTSATDRERAKIKIDAGFCQKLPERTDMLVINKTLRIATGGDDVVADLGQLFRKQEADVVMQEVMPGNQPGDDVEITIAVNAGELVGRSAARGLQHAGK